MTINSLNYGNRLQNYALQTVLESLGYSVETIKRCNYIWDERSIREIIANEMRVLFKTKKGLFIKFDRKYINYSIYYATANEIDSRITDDYDFFISGSDQIWNPFFSYRVGSCDLLAFSPTEKRISYAASFGVDSIPEELKPMYQEQLAKYSFLSVREQAGVKLIKELANKDATLVLDPTLLLEENDWNQIAMKPASVPVSKYALVYIIGGYSHKENDDIIKAREKDGLVIVDVLKQDDNGKNLPIGPAEFIWLIKHAEKVITDSFHATVFSIIFGTTVSTHQRDGINMSSRILSLAGTTGLKERIDDDGVFRVNKDEDFINARKKITEAKDFSVNFLANALKTI